MPRFDSESEYIAARRKAAKAEGIAGDGAVALCFSGGGLRSATVQIGVLQGLQEAGLLKEADYLSTASGGAYTGAWFVSHYLPLGSKTIASSDRPLLKGSPSDYTSDPSLLLQTGPPGARPWGPDAPLAKHGPWHKHQQLPGGGEAEEPRGAVDRLEINRGFVLGQWNKDLAWLIPYQAATIPFSAIFDIGLHLKPARGKWNFLHPNYQYENNIQKAYLQRPAEALKFQTDVTGDWFGEDPHDVCLAEINPAGSPAPYLVINASLCNSTPGSGVLDPDVLPFEFSRDSCGGPMLGYVAAKNFGFPVENVRHNADGSGEAVLRANSIPGLPFTTKPVKLSAAVAASGAAFDLLSVGAKVALGRPGDVGVWPPGGGHAIPRMKPTLTWLDHLASVFNLNLRYHNRNFAMQPPGSDARGWGAGGDAMDRLKEASINRFKVTTRDNSLYLTDGGHTDNLGMWSMSLRPSVKEMWVFDAGEDADYDFDDLKKSMRFLALDGWSWNIGDWKPAVPCRICQHDSYAEPAVVEQMERLHSEKGSFTGRTVEDLLKGKSKETGMTPDWSTLDNGKPLSPVFSITLHRQGRSVLLRYVKSSWRSSDGAESWYMDNGSIADSRSKQGGQAAPLSDTQPLNRWFQTYRTTQHKTGRLFPHTGTMNLSFTGPDFTAYRELGRILAEHFADGMKGKGRR